MTYYCTECGKQCKGTVLDFGIGPYEYWGQHCVDTNKQFVSECCEADVSDNPENLHSLVTLEDIEQSAAEAKAERRLQRELDREFKEDNHGS